MLAKRPEAEAPKPARAQRLVVGITGATGAVYGVRLLAACRALGVQTHLVVTPSGVLNVHHELGLDRKALEALAASLRPGDVGACLASGSFDTAAMVVAPCSMKTLAAIAHGSVGQPADARRRRHAEGAPAPAADGARDAVQPGAPAQHDGRHRDGRRRLPAAAGVLPSRPSIDEMVDDSVERVLALLGLHGAAPREWHGL